MSGCYDYSDYGYQQSYEYNDCYQPRRHGRHHQKRHNGCWDYNSYCN